PQKPLSGDDGCGQELTNWYAMLKKAAIAGVGQPATGALRKSSPTMSKLPQECGTILTAGGFEPPVPADADTMPEPIRKALASKSGPPPPKLDPCDSAGVACEQFKSAVARAQSIALMAPSAVTHWPNP